MTIDPQLGNVGNSPGLFRFYSASVGTWIPAAVKITQCCDEWPSYVARRIQDCRDKDDAIAASLAIELGDVVQMGKVCAEPIPL